MEVEIKSVLGFLPDVHLGDLKSALGVLSAMITPVLLISASGSFIISTNARLGRVVDRLRDLTNKFEMLTAGERVPNDIADRRALIDWQLRQQMIRLEHLQRALFLFYICTTTFVTTSIAIAIIAVFEFKLFWIPVMMGLAGAFSFMAACFALISEVTVAGRMIRRETEFVHQLVLKSQHVFGND